MTDKRNEMPDEVRIMLEIASDKDVADCFHGTNFGSRKPREVIADTLLKTAGGYSTGHTALTICCELKLLTKRQKSYWLTKKGKSYLFWSHQRTRADISPPVADHAKTIRRTHEKEQTVAQGREGVTGELVTRDHKEILERLAWEVAKNVIDHHKNVYSAIFKAAPSTFPISMRNGIYNQIASAMKCKNDLEINDWIRSSEAHRKEMQRLKRKQK